MPLSRASSAGKRERARAYNKALPLTIRCLTWNVGNAKPVAAELAHALPDGLDEDIIVVGTQIDERKRTFASKKKTAALQKLPCPVILPCLQSPDLVWSLLTLSIIIWPGLFI